MKKVSTIILLLFFSLPAWGQSTLNGDWQGAIEVQNQKLAVIFHISGDTSYYYGTMDIPQQGAKGLPLSKAELKRDSVLLAFNTGQVSGEFRGVLKQDTLITGTYTQGISSFPFRLSRQPTVEVEPETGEKLLITNGANVIGGTLVLPEQEKSPPLVIMISGSGAQMRDSEIFGFRIFAQIAEHLRKEGIASFRFDDRETGKSTGSFSDATLDTLASDIKTIISHLQTSSEYSFKNIILLGHSQGGLVATKLAAESDTIDKLILMATPGVNMKQILRYQVRLAFGEGIHPPAEINKEISARERLMEALKQGEGIQKAKQGYIRQYSSMLRNLPEAQQNRIGNLNAFAQSQADELERIYSTPQMQSVLFYDPASDLKQLDIPVLVLFGEKDTQVTDELNLEPIEKALKTAGIPYRVKVFEHANHLFQKAGSGQAGEYALLDKRFADGFLTTISEWVNESS